MINHLIRGVIWQGLSLLPTLEIVTAKLSAITLHRELPAVCQFPGSVENLTADKCETGHLSLLLYSASSLPLN
jgi:hypothetical protein